MIGALIALALFGGAGAAIAVVAWGVYEAIVALTPQEEPKNDEIVPPPTQAPTYNPTERPTERPTVRPTGIPTMTPSEPPSEPPSGGADDTTAFPPIVKIAALGSAILVLLYSVYVINSPAKVAALVKFFHG